jgi:hypothetical protein
MFNDNRKQVDLGHRQDLDKHALLQKSKDERHKRQLNKRQTEAAITVQKLLRGFLASKHVAGTIVL